jgi:hypothetical protein
MQLLNRYANVNLPQAMDQDHESNLPKICRSQIARYLFATRSISLIIRQHWTTWLLISGGSITSGH